MAPGQTTTNQNGGQALNAALWIAQALLAFTFGFAGFLKVTQPIAALATQMPWTGAVPAALVRCIGVSELAGAIGLILPAATRIRPALTPLAAVGLVVIMGMAAGFHLSRGEVYMLPMNGVLGALAAFVAWGRFGKRPIAARS
ncbi:MAG: DoxX family protein [Acidobacteriota bacterium]